MEIAFKRTRTVTETHYATVPKFILDAMSTFLFGGELPMRIAAIKLIRGYMDELNKPDPNNVPFGLKEAKDFVEAYESRERSFR